ncbi:protein DEHYDRATION-INDUCED 19 homolog 4-like [Rhododendron vialii]|uniref:protein DEHYDRATION-INDUCED 19 homolog 4-like n=1 Tax=Rhododendron vialii TaxID=182163 RepID=UPI00265F75EB|nr:protein DEHYDRATION-INDUCED 19 homolog 4-like [Rhododendron vialii]
MADTRYFDLTTSLKQALDLHMDMEEDSEEENDDLKPEYVCPFCLDDFDLVGFCCHVDNGHPIEAKSGICPVCAKKVGINMAVHIITQHGSILNALYKKRLRHGGSHPTLSLLRKRSQEEYDDPLVEESSRVVSSSDIAADPMLSSLIYNPPPADVPEIRLSSSTAEANIAEESSDKFSLGRIIDPSPFSNKDQEEKARRCKFVQGLLFSTFLDDGL